MRRRTYVSIAGALGVAGLTGCLAAIETESTGPGADEPGTEPPETSASGPNTDTDDPEPTGTPTADGEPVAAIEAYFAAVAAGDTEALRETVHSESPFVSTIEAGEVTFPETQPSFDPDTAETVGADPTTSEIREFEAAGFVFDDGGLDAALADRSGVLVEAASEPTNLAIGETWVLLPDSGEWRVFWVGRRPDVPENPSDVFDPEIVDTDHDVVAEVDWEYEQDTDGAVSDVEWAKVVLTDNPGIEAEAIRIESTIEGWQTELSGGDDEVNGWADSWATVALHDEGDQLVVTAISEESETVVHRVHYEPATGTETASGRTTTDSA